MAAPSSIPVRRWSTACAWPPRGPTSSTSAIDTTRAAVAAACLDAGADWINDTSALLEDPDLGPLLAGRTCQIVLMHRFEPPRREGDRPTGRGLVELVADDLEQIRCRAIRQGIDPARIILDPGLGFGTLYADNLALIADVGPLRRLPHPLLFGPSRKSFLGRLTGRPALAGGRDPEGSRCRCDGRCSAGGGYPERGQGGLYRRCSGLSISGRC
jgi:dihydropteroate synthase